MDDPAQYTPTLAGKSPQLEDALLDELFPQVDLALRRGCHVDREDSAAYDYLCEMVAPLDALYQRFGAELIHQQSDGYFYLLPCGDRLRSQHLSAAEMLVGQTLALLYLDPATLKGGGVITRTHLLERLSSLLGTEALVRAMTGRRSKRYDERVAEKTARDKVNAALRELATLGFVVLLPEEALRLRPALMRFAEPVRALADPHDALQRLISAGELVVPELEHDETQPLEEEDE